MLAFCTHNNFRLDRVSNNYLIFCRVVLGFANRILGLQRGQQKWSVESVHTKNIVSILHLLVALARHFRAPIRLPENVVVDVVIVQKKDGKLFNHM